MEKEFEETARKAPPEIDGRALMWTYESLDEDDELELFFSGIPDFCSSKVVHDPQSSFEGLRNWRVADALVGFLERTWSSNLISEAKKMERLVICIRATDAAYLSDVAWIILGYFFDHRPALFQSIELGQSLMSQGNNDDNKHTLFAQCIIVCIIAEAPQRNEHWFSLTMHQLGISEHVLQSYLNYGESVQLATLIHFTRQLVRSHSEDHWEGYPRTQFITLSRLVSDYNVQDTLPELQHDFCGLWNEIVLQRRDGDHCVLSDILELICPIYVTLHRGFTEDDRYSLCSIPSHRIHLASNLNEVNNIETGETTHDLVITSPALLHHDAISPVIQSVSTYAPPSPVANLDHMITHPADEPSQQEVANMLQRSILVTPSFHTPPLNFEPFERSSSSAAAGPIQGTTMVHQPLPVIVSSIVDHSCPDPSGDTVLRHTGNTTTTFPPSSVPNVVPSPSPILIVSSADHAAPHIPADATINQLDHAPRDECQ
jgi:hypothetical protein